MSNTRATIEAEVNFDDIGQRIDVVLTNSTAELLQAVGICDIETSRSRIKRWIEQGRVSLDGKIVSKAGLKLKHGSEVISVEVPNSEVINLTPDPSVAFNIVYEDSSLLVVDKPADLVVHPAPGNYQATLVHGLLAHLGDELAQIGDALRPGIVHRLDKDTSGLMVVAKTDHAYQHLRNQFIPPRTITRTYLAITLRLPAGKISGTIDFPIGRDPHNRMKMAVIANGKPSTTHYEMQQQLKNGYILKCLLETGRTHQIRLHLAALNAAVVGDQLYGQPDVSVSPKIKSQILRLKRHALHASELTFKHPANDKIMHFHSPLPLELEELLEVLNE